MFAIATVILYARFHFPLYFSSIRYSKQQTQVAYLLKTAHDYLTGAVCCHAICHKSFIFYLKNKVHRMRMEHKATKCFPQS